MKVETLRSIASQKKRELIVDAAVKCFVEKGFHQTSVRDIASEANISLGNLYNHFAGKSALIVELAAIESLELDQFVTLVNQNKSASILLKNFVDQFLGYCLDPVNAALSVEFAAEALRNDEVGKAFYKNRMAISLALREMIKRGVAQGEFASDTNIELAPDFILDLVEGLAIRNTMSGKKPDKLVRNEVHRVIEKYLLA